MKKDLIILAADEQARSMLIPLLERIPAVFGLRSFSADVIVHEKRDPGCYTKGVDKLNGHANEYDNCILIFDHEGCGAEHKKSAMEIEAELEKELENGLWPNRNAVVVIEPELENWVWTDSVHTSDAMGWGTDLEQLQQWLIAQKLLKTNALKPERPKEAMDAAVKHRLRKPISKTTFASIAAKASFKSCTSPSFLKFKDTILRWFTPENP